MIFSENSVNILFYAIPCPAPAIPCIPYPPLPLPSFYLFFYAFFPNLFFFIFA